MCVRILGKDFHIRAVLMMLIGIAWINIGIVIFIDKTISEFHQNLFFFSIPTVIKSLLWTTTGIIALVSAVTHIKEKFGWIALVIMPVEEAVSCFASFIAWLGLNAPNGLISGLNLAVLWACVTSGIMFLASLTDRNIR